MGIEWTSHSSTHLGSHRGYAFVAVNTRLEGFLSYIEDLSKLWTYGQANAHQEAIFGTDQTSCALIVGQGWFQESHLHGLFGLEFYIRARQYTDLYLSSICGNDQNELQEKGKLPEQGIMQRVWFPALGYDIHHGTCPGIEITRRSINLRSEDRKDEGYTIHRYNIHTILIPQGHKRYVPV